MDSVFFLSAAICFILGRNKRTSRVGLLVFLPLISGIAGGYTASLNHDSIHDVVKSPVGGLLYGTDVDARRKF